MKTIYRNLRRCLEEAKLCSQLNSYKDCGEAYTFYINTVNTLYDKSFPYVRVSRKRLKDKKWITSGIRKSCHTKNKLYKKCLGKPTENNQLRNLRNIEICLIK